MSLEVDSRTSDWIRTSADERAVADGCWFDLHAAERVRTFFRKFLRHSKGQWAGQPFDLLEWQWQEVVAPLFGWKRPDGTRRFRRGYIEVPKKNGKSTLFSGLSLYLLVGDNEPGAEIYSAAVDRDQASIVYGEAAHMVDESPDLSRRLKVVRSTKRIVYHRTRSFYKALSADVPAKEGLNAHAVLIDELHAQRTRDLWDTLRYAGASRRQPLQLAITTAGYDRHSICWEQHDYALKVLDGTIEDTSFFPFVAAANDEADWTDPNVWRTANPSFGITINADQFAEDCTEAQESPAKENSFRRYRLNQWTEQDVRWLSMDKWDACGTPLENLRGRVCFGGLDLSSTTDVSALVLVFPDEDEGRFDVLPYFWVPEEGARKRERRDRVPYVQWIRDDHMEATSGEVVDYDVIRRRINELNEQFEIREIAIDRWNATQLATQLEGDGFEMVAFGQGYASMSSPTKKLEEVVLSRKLAHAGHPVLRWMAGNVSIETDAADNWKPSKKKSVERIDGIVALIMGLDRASTQDVCTSVYDKRGILSL
ncbi:Phage Terminase [Symmachiella dynata]|uniref:Phage Terminase n=1 Tax=Symmachiella dynata TaxID=2527995 RepID=A0A517ZPB0_9PLAN|nr:terminase TerL endonuclease subunit [Symmachiella dynata]QDU44315.1 Phage Terminase [Symmachiella dynata]